VRSNGKEYPEQDTGDQVFDVRLPHNVLPVSELTDSLMTA